MRASFYVILFLNILLFDGNFLAAGLLSNPDKFIEARDADGIVKLDKRSYMRVSEGIRDTYSVVLVNQPYAEACDSCILFGKQAREISRTLLQNKPDINVIFYDIDPYEVLMVQEDLRIEYLPTLLIYPPPTRKNFHMSTAAHTRLTAMTLEELEDVNYVKNFITNGLNITLEDLEMTVPEQFNVVSYGKYFGIFVATGIASEALLAVLK
ncbi:hypothetical protein Kpol_513p31 [Vanderwaltozyma polyspora DSM 70294]|uniref:Thioredoxin domain-containing protein n=1 Tax=Vanderwaltozyma polyspora (strain ATCC 22028 / DSM 70294 / BCRC 21397 / CBS 2163 / NBRC 10782 / NRRL Y-8283 / UCD 57-17) TaxID=436907 RepID=A7TML7_VANPO|nr:uncharacterized protein Kpol_513p31 [Vanderwaltozyma polyspora DSM 70294]EDO16515.1 hypothetical protein Kpol_513p31 [Vanderwaltozyma polyspora DSM 70294]